jgi:chitinase
VAATTDYVLSGQPDPDGNVADLLELYWYEDECYPIPNTGDPDSMKRWLPELEYGYEGKRPTAMPPGSRNDGVPKICNADNECYNVLSPEKDIGFQQLLSSALNHSHAVLEPRGRVAKICLPKGKSNSFKAKYYPGVLPLSARGRQFYGAMKTGVQTGLCAALPLVLGPRVLGEDYVTEHVMELQTPAQFANSMLKGLLPSGATAPGSGYDWTQVFGPNGYMFQTWAQLGISPPSGLTGATPQDALYNALGSTADINNLQILDAATNSLKAGVSDNPGAYVTIPVTEMGSGLATFQKYYLSHTLYQ